MSITPGQSFAAGGISRPLSARSNIKVRVRISREWFSGVLDDSEVHSPWRSRARYRLSSAARGTQDQRHARCERRQSARGYDRSSKRLATGSSQPGSNSGTVGNLVETSPEGRAIGQVDALFAMGGIEHPDREAAPSEQEVDHVLVAQALASVAIWLSACQGCTSYQERSPAGWILNSRADPQVATGPLRLPAYCDSRGASP